MSIIDDITTWAADRYHYATQKFRTPRKVPAYIGAEIDEVGVFNIDSLFRREMSEEQKQKAALSISWVFSNIRRISNEVSGARIDVFEHDTNEKDIDHEFERLIERPNEFFGRNALIQYTVWALMLSSKGAYWYLAPDQNGNLREIWPVPINKLTPVKHASQFISHYEYETRPGEKPLRIPTRYICRFFFPNPFDIWESLTPLNASMNSINIYEGISKSQTSLFTQGGGIPLSVVTIDQNISEPDFAIVRERIRQDWLDSKRIAVARAGTIDVKTIGISNKDLEVVQSQELNRDEIDSIFMGIPWRSTALIGGEGLREANRQIKEQVIYPIHLLFSSQIQIQIIDRFYGDNYVVRFEDIRQQDRALLIQERNIIWRVKTLDEARADLGLPPFKHKDFDLGGLPTPLAANASFVSAMFGLDREIPNPAKKPIGVGNLTEQFAPEATTNNLARGGGRPDADETNKAAIIAGIKAELKRFKTVTLRHYRKEQNTDVTFETIIIPDNIMESIMLQLKNIASEDDIKAVFENIVNDYN